MKAAYFERFGEPLKIGAIEDPEPESHGVVVRVRASGICRSDWHAWRGHDPDIRSLPHVPGHELAGTVEDVGGEVRRWKRGDRVTVPFASGCGTCRDCASGNMQVCHRQFQPGFSGPGSFAEHVALPWADTNLVAIPESVDDVTAASLGCRFATAFRAVIDQGGVRKGHWVAVHGAGGVGLSALMIAKAVGARVIAVDPKPEARDRAEAFGADETIKGSADEVVGAIRDITGGGADVSMDAVGNVAASANSVRCLRNRGRHVQIGLMFGDHANPALPMGEVIARELELFGSHGMSAADYPRMLELIVTGKVAPEKLIGKRVALEEASEVLERMGRYADCGISVIEML